MTGLVCLPITLATPVRTPSISRGVFCADTGADHAVAFMCARLVMPQQCTKFYQRLALNRSWPTNTQRGARGDKQNGWVERERVSCCVRRMGECAAAHPCTRRGRGLSDEV